MAAGGRAGNAAAVKLKWRYTGGRKRQKENKETAGNQAALSRQPRNAAKALGEELLIG